MDKDWQSGKAKRIKKIENRHLRNFKFDSFIFHKLQELVAKRQISRNPLSGSDLAPSADTWGSLALRTEAERAADQEKQPWPRCRLWQLWPGKSQFTILSQMFIVGLLWWFSLLQVQMFQNKVLSRLYIFWAVFVLTWRWSLIISQQSSPLAGNTERGSTELGKWSSWNSGKNWPPHLASKLFSF